MKRDNSNGRGGSGDTEFNTMKVHCSNNDFDDEDMSVVSGHSSVRERIGEKETAIVNLSKVLVFLSICILAILIGYVTRSFLESQDKTEYQTEVRVVF